MLRYLRKYALLFQDHLQYINQKKSAYLQVKSDIMKTEISKNIHITSYEEVLIMFREKNYKIKIRLDINKNSGERFKGRFKYPFITIGPFHVSKTIIFI